MSGKTTKVEATDTDFGKKLLQELKALASKQVTVGFKAGEVFDADGMDVAKKAAINEYGTDTIPARPFMRQTIENHVDELTKYCQSMAKSVKNRGSADEVLQGIGEHLVKMVRDEIENGEFEPNAPSTIRRKGSDKPLIDTGQMKDAVRYFIIEGE